MPTLTEQKIACSFPDGWRATRFDDWQFYKSRFKDCCGGNKAVDFLALNPVDGALWLVEIKDYRRFPRTKDTKIHLWDEVAVKARDTLAGLFAARVDANHPDHEHAAAALRAKRLRVVLHLEQPRTHSKLRPRAYDRAHVQQRLKQILKPIDAHPQVVELDDMTRAPWMAWSVADPS